MDPFTKPQPPVTLSPRAGRAACRAPRETTPLQASTRFVDALADLHQDGSLAGFLVGCTIAEHNVKSHDRRVAETFAALGDLVRAVARELDRAEE